MVYPLLKHTHSGNEGGKFRIKNDFKHNIDEQIGLVFVSQNILKILKHWNVTVVTGIWVFPVLVFCKIHSKSVKVGLH